MERKRIIIIGGGTAGLTIANRLQEHFEVTVIEKSRYRRYPFYFGIPLMIGILFRTKIGSYINKREFRLQDGRLVPFFESNLWGGASVMNGCVHVFGFKSKWKSVLDRFKLDYNELMRSYAELFSEDRAEKHKITISRAHQTVVDRTFITAIGAAGILPDDMCHSETQACGPIHNTIRKRFRTSVLSLLRKKNFKTIMNETVNEIVYDEHSREWGVKIENGIKKADFVILSAGVIGSCKLLLKNKNQNGKANLNGLKIGEGLQDHTNLRINVLANRPIGSLNEIYSSLPGKVCLGFKHFIGKSTVMKGTGATSAAYLDLDGDGEVDTRIQILQFAETGRHGSTGKVFDTNLPSFSISINAIHPESSGQITLENDDCNVDPMFLTAPKDMEILKLALSYCLKLLKNSPIKKLVDEIIAEDLIENNPEKYIRDNIYSGHHLIGGLQNIVGSDFQLQNTEGLYVCDASIFDCYVASNIHSSVILIADLFAKKFIVKNYAS